MHCGTVSFVISVLTFSMCGAWVNIVQHPFNQRPTIASESVHAALVHSKIIPDVVDDFKPSVYVTLSYASKHKTVDLGNKIKPKKVTSQPVFSINASPMTPTRTFESNMTYTLVLSDPDATSRAEPVKAQMCHWIVANLTLPFQPADPDGALGWAQSFGPARETQENSVEEIMPYLPPTPPPKTGYHRYVFVLLAPGTGEDTQGELTKPKERPHWGYGKVGAGVREWADENGLVVVGANFFYSQNKNQ